ncbi:hypothetical protein LPB142_03040 [Rhodobacter xanthinilyticus]|uniref:Uncharacterized protein n=2 Tax=Rhodobacter xanthinilyticus TaxID=1850250 RepID=A0A1D9M976_9RHOB|nr:hypothetical protein LPB142_03040 [Rhodobacter xanthinilyticus]
MSWWAELASVATALVAVFAAVVTYRQWMSWRDQVLKNRVAEVADRISAASQEIEWLVRLALTHVVGEGTPTGTAVNVIGQHALECVNRIGPQRREIDIEHVRLQALGAATPQMRASIEAIKQLLSELEGAAKIAVQISTRWESAPPEIRGFVTGQLGIGTLGPAPAKKITEHDQELRELLIPLMRLEWRTK